MRNQNRVSIIGLPPVNQTTNCAYSDRLPFAQTYLRICCLHISSYTFCPDEDTRREHKMHVCRVPKCPTALNVRQILLFSKSVILGTEIIINSKRSKYFKKIKNEKYSESNLEKNLPDI